MNVEHDRRVLENARSNRSTCCTCDQRIDKEAIRFARPGIFGPLGGWHHATCAAEDFPHELMPLLELWPEDTGDLERAVRNTLARVEAPDLCALEAPLKARDWNGVLTVLARRWSRTRDDRIGTLMAAITAGHLSGLQLPTRSNAEAWIQQQPDDMLGRGAVMAMIPRLPQRAHADLLNLASSGPPDPRWLDLVLPWIARMVEADQSNRIEYLLRVLDRLECPRIDAELPLTADHMILQLWSRHRTPFTPPDLLAADELRLLEQARAIVDEAFGQAVDTDALFLSGAAGDDEALAVLADVLTRTNDPRGEFLLLSQIEAPTTAQKRRLKSLQRTSWRELLGDLEGCVLKRDLHFERGLPHTVAVSLTPARLAEATQLLGWASVEVLALANPNALQVVDFPRSKRLRKVTQVNGHLLPILLFEGPENTRIDEVVVSTPAPPRWPDKPCRLSNLRRVVLNEQWTPGFARRLRRHLPGVEVVFE